MDFSLWWINGKDSSCNAGDAVSTSGLGRSPGGGNGNPLQNSWLGNLTDRGAWSRILAWEISQTEEPGGLQSIMLQRVGHNLATKQQNPKARAHKTDQKHSKICLWLKEFNDLLKKVNSTKNMIGWPWWIFCHLFSNETIWVAMGGKAYNHIS